VLLTPGHESLRLPLAPTRDLKRVLLYDGEVASEVGTAAEELVVESGGGRPVLRRLQLVRFAPIGELAGISTAVAATLEPLTHETRHADLRIEATYGEFEVSGSIARRDGSLTPFSRPRSSMVFDLYGLEVVLRALPLGRDYAAEVELFWPERTATATARVRVVGSEQVPAGGGRDEEAWILAVTLADIETAYRIGIESRELLQQTQRLADGTRVDFVR